MLLSQQNQNNIKMKDNLEKRAEELEQTLKMQLNMVKHESGEIVKVGGTVLVGGLITYTLIRMFKKKKRRKTDVVMEALQRQGLLDDEIKARLTRKKSSGLFGRLSAVLMPMAVNYGKSMFLQRLEQSKNKSNEA